MYKANDKYCCVCRSCLDELFNEYSRRYGSDKIATIIICHYLDIPFYYSLYDSIIKNNQNFTIGMYTRQVTNQKQYSNKTFINTLLDKKELGITESDFDKEKEDKWTDEENKYKDEAISVVGYDPFDGYSSENRRFLFGELIKYFDDDIADDTYKLSQIIQIVNNNNQIRQYDLLISKLDPAKDATDIQNLCNLKKACVSSNDKIAKENEISVKNRSDKEAGKSTLTYLMKDLREKNFKVAEANYYDQLRSEGTLWAIDMSNKAIIQNGFFDENDKQEIFDTQRELIQNLQQQLDDKNEEYRLLLIQSEELKKQLNGDNNE